MTAGYATFTAGGGRYLYDTGTNALVEVSPAAADLLEGSFRPGSREAVRSLAGRWPARDLREAVAFLRACRDRGMLRDLPRLDFSAVARPGHLRRLYRQGPRRMTLGITERCNQRCRYCPFVAVKGAPRRADMTWEVARRSVDRFLAGAPRGSRPTLELFGGEPALDWPLVAGVIGHVREVHRRRDVELILYTNATLLDAHRIDLLASADVVLMVSLDGPAHVHDRERRLAGGAATHAGVLRALRDIRRRHPAYRRRRVRLHCTFGLESDLLEVFRYFSRPAFRDVEVTFGYRSGGAPDGPADLARHEAQLDLLDAWHLEALQGRRAFHGGLYVSLLAAVLGGVLGRRVGAAGSAPHPNRACLPGQTRCFVSGSGAIHPCEHHVGAGSEIGDWRTGVDLEKAAALLRAHAGLCNQTCQGCWAWRLCSHCFLNSLDARGRPSRDSKEDQCRLERERILRSLRRWVRVWKGEPARAAKVKGTLRWAEGHPDVQV
jgi:uncharacterized protein